MFGLPVLVSNDRDLFRESAIERSSLSLSGVNGAGFLAVTPGAIANVATA
jgi:hypothetical protein